MTEISKEVLEAALFAWERAQGAADDGPREYDLIDVAGMSAALAALEAMKEHPHDPT